MKIFLILACSSIAFAQVTNVRTQATPTQIILSYTAPDQSACTVEASESASYTPLVHDVDPTLFSGSNLDSRAGNITRGRARVFVIGQRIAAAGSDGKNYSRALQHSTKHYLRITCGSDTATATATTAVLPWGNTFPDVTPAVWPDISWTSRHETVVDPLTGTLLKRMTFPGAEKTDSKTHGYLVTAAEGVNWTNPSNVIADDSAFATYSASTQDPLFVSDSIDTSIDGMPNGLNIVEGLTLRLYARVADAATGTDKQGETCISLNRLTCYGPWLSFTAQTVTEYAGGKAIISVGDALGTHTGVIGPWLNANQKPLGLGDMVVRSGIVNTSGTAVQWVHADGATAFSPNWVAGSKITINGTEYTIASVQSPLALTLATSAGVQTGVAYSARNFGFLIRKKTTSTHLLEINFVAVEKFVGFTPLFNGGSGSSQMCAPRLTADGAGKMGYHCAVFAGATDWWLFWIAPVDGEVRYLGPIWTQAADANIQICNTTSWSWDISHPTYDAIWCGATSRDQTRRYVVRGRYVGANTDRGEQIATGDSTTQNQWAWVSMYGDGTTDFAGAMTAFEPDFDTSRYGAPIPVGVQNGKLQMQSLHGSQDSPGWTVVYDTTSNQVIASQPSWKYQPSRWCAIHTNLALHDSPWINIQGTHINGCGGMGPYMSLTTQSMSGTPGSCPANPYGVTGNKCTTVTVNGEPAGPTPGTSAYCNGTTAGSITYLQDVAVGDTFRSSDGEQFRLLAKSGNSWTLERGYDRDNTMTAHSSGMSLIAECSAIPFKLFGQGGAAGPTWWWDYVNDPHGKNLSDPYGLGGSGAGSLVDYAFPDSHPDHRMGVTIYDGPDYTKLYGTSPDPNWCASGSAYSSPYGLRRGSWPGHLSGTTWCVQSNPPFAGQYGVGYGEAAEHHSSYSTNDPAAHASARTWFMDGRPQNVNQDLALTAAAVSGQLYKVTAYDTPGSKNHKKLPLLVWPGKNVAVDISSAATGDVIGTTSADSYKYCLALNVNECRTGSAVGDVYVNAPNVAVTPPGWAYGAGVYKCFNKIVAEGAANDPCVVVAFAHSDYATQYKLTDRHETSGKVSRPVTKGLMPPRTSNFLWNVRPLPDGSYVMFDSILQGIRTDVMLAKLPPTGADDSVDRTTFIPTRLDLQAPSGTNNAIVEFGYNSSFHCMSRAEACVSNASSPTWDATNPYWWAGEAPSGVSCSTSCTVYIPAISSRVLYYRVKYRDASNVVLATSQTEVVAVK